MPDSRTPPLGIGIPQHEHVWDTETDEFSTFTPDPGLDDPWVIHECVVGRCHALQITRPIFGVEQPQTIVYERAGGPS